MLKQLILIAASVITISLGGSLDEDGYSGIINIHITEKEPTTKSIDSPIELFSFEL